MNPVNEISTGKRWELPAQLVILFFLLVLSYDQRWADGDVWGHLYFGRDYFRAGGLFIRDPYSFTAYGSPWYGHEALFELVFWKIYEWGGAIGIVVGKTLIGLSALLILWKTSSESVFRERDGQCRSLALLISVMLCSQAAALYFQVRPQLFTYVFLAIYVWSLNGVSRGKNLGRIWLLPPVMVVWANSHGGFLAGLGLIVLYIAGAWLDGRFGSTSATKKPIVSILAWVGLGTLACTFLNPIGWKLWWTVIRALFNPLTQNYVREWSGISLSAPDVQTGYFLVNVVLLVPMLIISRSRRTYTDFLIAFAGIALPFMSYRHVPLSAILLAPIFASSLADSLEQLRDRLKRVPEKATIRRIWAFTGMCVGVGLLFIAFQPVLRVWKYPSPSLELISCAPVRAVKFMQEAGLSGNVFCDFMFGEYLIWQLGDTCKVGMDGRYDTVYPIEVIKDFLAVRNEPVRLGKNETLKKYDSHLLLFPPDTALVKDLNQKPDDTWVRIFQDDLAALFIRSDLLASDGVVLESQLSRLQKLEKRILLEPTEKVFPSLLTIPTKLPTAELQEMR